MIFGPTSLADALGAVLAHTQRLEGKVLRKGTVLDAPALEALRAGGIEQVIAARLEPGDVAENPAADRLAAALATTDITAGPATTGRANLHATAAGLLRVDGAVVDALNAIDESFTLGTLTDYAAVAAGEIMATIKINPFAVAGALLAQAEALAARQPVFTLHRFRPLRVGLVLTSLPGLKQSILDGTIAATEARVSALSGELLPARICAHESAAITPHLHGLLAEGADILLIAGASAVVDRRDEGPAAIVAAGGEIRHFGMPVDPGNLICMGRIGPRPALVLPGCARSPKLNGIDLVLARLFAGLEVGGAEMTRMGVGGLLRDVDQRPRPRAQNHAPRPAAPRAAPVVAAVVLAAGYSRRMAPRNKLLTPLPDGRAMIAHVVDAALASRAHPVLVVTGHQHDQIAAALAGRAVRLVPAPDHAEGLAGSLRAGIAAVPEECAAALICLGDMPLVGSAVLDRLIAAYDPAAGRRIIIPTFSGQQGNPVLWDRACFAEIRGLTGDAGARQLLGAHREMIHEVAMEDAAVLRDFDTIDTLAELGAAT